MHRRRRAGQGGRPARRVRFADAEFLLRIEPRKGSIATPWFELDASGKDKAHPDAAGATGRLAVWGVDSIEVLWPSGKKQTVRAPIKINSLIEVRES